MVKQTAKLLGFLLCLVCISLTTASAQSNDVVLYASEAPVRVGGWIIESDSSAAGGACLAHPNADAAKQRRPLADPRHYFEMTFDAEANKPYHLWIRGKAEDNNWSNDSVFVQFSESLGADGSSVYRIGTTSAASVTIEDGIARGLRGWGWQDNGWQSLGRSIYFAQDGAQTIRIQTREDGLRIDQIVLSSDTFIDSAPGSLRDDTTILPKSGNIATANKKPLVTVDASVQSGTAPLPVDFSANGSDSDGTVVRYYWSFGDGQTSTSNNPSHTYVSAGTYTAKVTATDNDGATASASIVITVTNPSSSGRSQLKVLTWNVHKGVGTDNERNLDRFVNWIDLLDADLVELCEIVRFSINDDGDDDDDEDPRDDQPLYILDRLEKKTGRPWYLHWVPKYSGSKEGNAILSKYRFLSKRGKYLSHGRSVAQVEVSIGGRSVHFFGTHLSVESGSWREDQVRELKDWMDNFGGPQIIGGDFNAGSTTNEIEMLTSSYYDAWAEAVKDNTDKAYPDNTSGRTRRSRIDFIFYGKNTANLVLKEARVPDTRNLKDKDVKDELGTADDKGVRPSDHNAVMATFEVR